VGNNFFVNKINKNIILVPNTYYYFLVTSHDYIGITFRPRTFGDQTHLMGIQYNGKVGIVSALATKCLIFYVAVFILGNRAQFVGILLTLPERY
jgi:hypothetical protein